MNRIKFSALLIACMVGLSASAASIKWCVSPGSVTDPSSSSLLENATVYLFIGTSEDATAAYTALTTPGSSWTYDTSISSGTTNASGAIGSIELSDDSWASGATVSLYVVTLYTDSTTNTGYAMVSSIVEVDAGVDGTGQPVNTAYFRAASIDGTSGGWFVVVPEPTSLALLALGVAGLALRRKVA